MAPSMHIRNAATTASNDRRTIDRELVAHNDIGGFDIGGFNAKRELDASASGARMRVNSSPGSAGLGDNISTGTSSRRSSGPAGAGDNILDAGANLGSLAGG